MPGLELYGSSEPATVRTVVEVSEPVTPVEESLQDAPRNPTVYYNPRLDPKNFLEGSLSLDPATRLRQMLARPGIVVRTLTSWIAAPAHRASGCARYLRRYQCPLCA